MASRNNPAVHEPVSASQRKLHPDTGEMYSIVSVELPDGGFVATIEEDQSFCATAATREQAEDAAQLRYLEATGDDPDDGPVSDEDMTRYMASYERSKREWRAGLYTEIALD